MNVKVPVSVEYFTSAILPNATDADTIIYLTSGDELIRQITKNCISLNGKQINLFVYFAGDEISPIEALHKAGNSPIKSLTLRIRTNTNSLNPAADDADIITINLSPVAVSMEMESLLRQLACKFVCNAITTGAHIAKGTVFTNLMINLALR